MHACWCSNIYFPEQNNYSETFMNFQIVKYIKNDCLKHSNVQNSFKIFILLLIKDREEKEQI